MSAIKSGVEVVQSLADGTLAVVKSSHGGTRTLISAEIHALNHLNACGLSVPKVIDHAMKNPVTPETPLYVVMEFIEGVTVKEYVKSAQLTFEHFAQIESVVLTAHSVGYTHGDIKPSNVMIRDDGPVVVIDWGGSQEAPSSPTADRTLWEYSLAQDLELLKEVQGW